MDTRCERGEASCKCMTVVLAKRINLLQPIRSHTKFNKNTVEIFTKLLPSKVVSLLWLWWWRWWCPSIVFSDVISCVNDKTSELFWKWRIDTENNFLKCLIINTVDNYNCNSQCKYKGVIFFLVQILKREGCEILHYMTLQFCYTTRRLYQPSISSFSPFLILLQLPCLKPQNNHGKPCQCETSLSFQRHSRNQIKAGSPFNYKCYMQLAFEISLMHSGGTVTLPLHLNLDKRLSVGQFFHCNCASIPDYRLGGLGQTAAAPPL